jgi:hypothetical protein
MTHDVFVMVPVSGQAIREPGIPDVVMQEAIDAYTRRLAELHLPTESHPDIVIMAVPQGRGYQVAANLANGGFAHGDVVAERRPEALT